MSHIPIGKTSDLQLLSFYNALKQYNSLQNRSYDHTKWLFVPDFYTEYRYILGTKGQKPPLITIGINPSTAAPDSLDNTLKSVERIASHNGFDSFIMFNVYAQRATDPKNMESEFNEALHRENMAAFEYVLSLSEEPSIWAAWGTNIKRYPYLKQCLTDMVKIGLMHSAKWFTCGTRSHIGKHPHHPLYLPKNSFLEHFDPLEYLSSLL